MNKFLNAKWQSLHKELKQKESSITYLNKIVNMCKVFNLGKPCLIEEFEKNYL